MSGAIQAGHRAALEVLAEVCPGVLTQEEQEAVQRSLAEVDPAEQPQPPKQSYLSANKTMVLATLTMGVAVLLAWHPDALVKVKAYVTNAF